MNASPPKTWWARFAQPTLRSSIPASDALFRTTSANRPPSRARRQLFGAVPLRHVDHRLHRSGEFVDVAHIGKIPLRYTAQRLRCDAVEQDQAEIAVLAARRSAGVEFFPAKMERGVGIFPDHIPMRDDVRMLADQRKSLIGVRRQFEEQQRATLSGPRTHRDTRPTARH